MMSDLHDYLYTIRAAQSACAAIGDYKVSDELEKLKAELINQISTRQAEKADFYNLVTAKFFNLSSVQRFGAVTYYTLPEFRLAIPSNRTTTANELLDFLLKKVKQNE